jgi:hypothetical protein
MAVKLGKVDVDREILGVITLDQLLEWQAFAELEPFDEVRQDLRIASIVEVLLNINRDTKRKPVPYTLKDTVLYFGDSKKAEEKAGIKAALPWQKLKAKCKAIASFFNAKLDKKEQRDKARAERLARRRVYQPPEPRRRGKVIKGG